MRQLSAIILLIASTTLGMAPAVAQNNSSAAGQSTENPKPKKTPPKKTSSKKKETAPVAEDTVKETEVDGLQAVAYDCELGNKLTVYGNPSDEQKITLRWNKRLHQMDRVMTTSGAHRFENTKNGLVWINIPAKGMLLDAKKGQQLANECKNAEQMATKN